MRFVELIVWFCLLAVVCHVGIGVENIVRPITIKGRNGFTAESIQSVMEGRSLQLICVIRNSSFLNISWVKDNVTLSINKKLENSSEFDRYEINMTLQDSGRRFYKLGIRNVSRIDSGIYACMSEHADAKDEVDIKIRFPPRSRFPLCSVHRNSSDPTSDDGLSQFDCTTEIGHPPYHTAWYQGGEPYPQDYVEINENNGYLTSTIRVNMTISTNIDSEYECRLSFRNVEIPNRRCCVESGKVCNSSLVDILSSSIAPTENSQRSTEEQAGRTSLITTTSSQSLTELMEDDQTKSTVSTSSEKNFPSTSPVQQTASITHPSTLDSTRDDGIFTIVTVALDNAEQGQSTVSNRVQTRNTTREMLSLPHSTELVTYHNLTMEEEIINFTTPKGLRDNASESDNVAYRTTERKFNYGSDTPGYYPSDVASRTHSVSSFVKDTISSSNSSYNEASRNNLCMTLIIIITLVAKFL